MPESGYLKHISVTSVGGVRVMSCLRCGFSIGGTRDELLRKIVQQHECRDEREPAKDKKTPKSPNQ